MKKFRKEYYRRIRLVLKTELNSKNRIEALNTLAVPVVQYSFNILNWKMDEIRQMDTKARKLLTSNRMHHPKADVDCLYLPRRNGGRGIINLETAYKTSTIGMATYLSVSKDWMINLVHQHEQSNKLFSINKEGRKYEREFEFVDNFDRNDELPATKQAKSSKLGMKQATERWNQKSLHGKYPLCCQQADVDQAATHQWLRCSGLEAETEGFILAAQNQSLFTRNYQENILKNGANEKCRTIQANRPDVIIKDFKEKTCFLIEISVPCDQNIAPKEFDKLSKYKDLEIEIQKMWSPKAITVPVIVGALGMIKKKTQKHVD
eukprot:gene862-154_t